MPGAGYDHFEVVIGVHNERMRLQSSKMHDHFSGVAATYNELRTTDLEPILFIKSVLGKHRSLRGIDVACGGGRYSLLLYQHLAGLELIVHDVHESMLAEAIRHLAAHRVVAVRAIQADVAGMRLPNGSLDAVFTFNAIHHFDPSLLLQKAAKALVVGGQLFIYTRLRSQNARSIWGRYFPDFAEKEDRLYRPSDIESWSEATDGLTPPLMHRFRYRRHATLSELLHEARNKHYSTFSLYSATEFDRALVEFETTIRKHFADPDHVEWTDENIMVVFRKDGPA